MAAQHGSFLFQISRGAHRHESRLENPAKQAEIPGAGDPWSGCVPLKILFSLVKLFESGEVRFTERKNKRLEICSDGSKHTLPFERTEKFPAILFPSGTSVQIDGEAISQMIGATSFWIRPDDIGLKPTERKQTGLSFRSNGESLEVMAFQRTVTAIATAKFDLPEFGFILPRQAVIALGKLQCALSSIWESGRVSFKGENRTLITQILEGQFPSWRAFLPKYEHSVSVSGTLRAALKRALITTGNGPKTFEALKLTFAKTFIKIESRGGDTGQSEEILETRSNLNGNEIVIGINAKQLLEALSVAEPSTCEILSPEQPLVFITNTEGYELRFLTMPCRLNF